MSDVVNRLTDLGIESRGKGWYELPNGDKVRGRQAALRAANGSARNGSAANSEATRYTLQRLDFLRQAGKQYAGSRDVYKVAGYELTPDFDDYWSYYDRHPIAGRIVDMPAQTTWRHEPEVIEPDNEEETEFTKAVAEFVKAHRLWQRLERADRLARIGRYGVLLIGVKGDTDFEAPLGRLSGPEDVAYLAHYSERDAKIDRFVEDGGDERFGAPEFYQIDTTRQNAKFQASTGRKRVHWSRVIHIAEDPLEDDIYGRPVLRRVLNAIFNDEKVDAASAEAFWQLADQILQLNIDPDAALSDSQLQEVEDAIQEIYHDLRKHFYLQGGELSWVGGDSPDPSAISDVLATKLAAGANIPKRILFGSERGELASTQDERNYFGTVSERQEHHAEPVLRTLIDRLIDHGGLPKPAAREYEVQWPDLYMPTEQERAERNSSISTTAKDLTPVGGDPYELVEVDDEGDVHLRPSVEVWKERGRKPGEIMPPVDPREAMGDEPPADTGEDEGGEMGEAA